MPLPRRADCQIDLPHLQKRLAKLAEASSAECLFGLLAAAALLGCSLSLLPCPSNSVDSAGLHSSVAAEGTVIRGAISIELRQVKRILAEAWDCHYMLPSSRKTLHVGKANDMRRHDIFVRGIVNMMSFRGRPMLFALASTANGLSWASAWGSPSESEESGSLSEPASEGANKSCRGCSLDLICRTVSDARALAGKGLAAGVSSTSLTDGSKWWSPEEAVALIYSYSFPIQNVVICWGTVQRSFWGSACLFTVFIDLLVSVFYLALENASRARWPECMLSVGTCRIVPLISSLHARRLLQEGALRLNEESFQQTCRKCLVVH